MTTAFVGRTHLGQVASTCWALKVGPVIAIGVPTPLSKPEPDLDQMQFDLHADGVLSVTTDLARVSECDIVVISQDVPILPDGRGDERVIRDLTYDVMGNMIQGSILVIMSQVSPGFTRSIDDDRRKWKQGPTFYWVENLILGQGVHRFLHPERIVVGCEHPSPKQPLPPALFSAFTKFECPIIQMRYESAELCKMASNVLLASSITAATTLDTLAQKVGAKWNEIIPALRLDPRIGEHAYIKPNPGLVGGQHLIRDILALWTLGHKHSMRMSFLDELMRGAQTGITHFSGKTY